ncbi:hypothetical protein GCM10009624_03690 [Gordonia sinesedis]
MARTADHAARRRQIYEAVRAISATDGLGAVTVARTADAAGISIGLVQHYFPRKQGLLIHAHSTLIGDIEARIGAAVAAMEEAHERIETILPTVLGELLPIDADRRAEAYLQLAFASAALDHPAIGVESRRWQRRIRRLIERAVVNGKECGEVDADADARLAAWELSSAVRGLVWTLYEEDTAAAADRALEVVGDITSRWFAGPCNRSPTVGPR